MDIKEVEQNNLQKEKNNIVNDKKEEENKATPQVENKDKPIIKNFQEEENQNNKPLENNEKTNNDNQKKDQITQRDAAINQFLDQIEGKNCKNDDNSTKIKNKEEESDDPFLKAENEYRKKNSQNPNNVEEKKSSDNKSKNNRYSNNLKYNTDNQNENYSAFTNKSRRKHLNVNILYNHFKNGINSKNEVKYTFKPSINKNPERLYLKAIEDNAINYMKMRSYNRRTGIFDFKLFNKRKFIYFNKNKNVNNYFNSTKTSFNKNNYNLTPSENRILSYNDYLKSINDKNRINSNHKLSKISQCIKNELLNSKGGEETLNNRENNLFYTSLSINSQLTEKNNKNTNNTKTENIINTNSPEEKKETKSETIVKNNKNNKNNKINKKIYYKTLNYKTHSANNNRMLSKKMKFDAVKNKNNQFKYNNVLLNSKIKNRKSSKQLLNKLLYSMNDPYNPYSINFSRNLLKNMFNMDIKFNKFELGVPLLRTKYSGKTSSLFSEKPTERMAKTSYNNFPKGYKTFYPKKNANKGNKRYFTMNNTGNNFYRK